MDLGRYQNAETIQRVINTAKTVAVVGGMYGPMTWDAANRRTLGIASLGGATLDNEENYLIKKLFTAMGAIQIENQARI